jgi:Flp pilus assembly protein TadG
MPGSLAAGFKKAMHRLARALRREGGSATVEFVIWIPVLLIILAITADACKLYLTQADMYNVARDTARRMSTGQLSTVATAKTYAQGELLYYNSNYTITPAMNATACASTGNTVDDVVTISVPVGKAAVFGILTVYGAFSTATLRAKVTMRQEDSAC